MMNNTCKEKSPEVHPPDPRALVAQLDRVLDYESRGRGFESSPVHQGIQGLSEKSLSPFSFLVPF